MSLLTKKLRKKIPPLYATEHQKNPLAVCKFFHPCSSWTWYVFEFDGKDTFFGFVAGIYPELGYFTLSELESFQDRWGIGIERDFTFEPIRLLEIKAKHALTG